MRIHGRIKSSTVNGPGLRAVIWFQGCTLACAGCWNPETWDAAAGYELTTAQVLEWLADAIATEGIEGVTFSGGEPMQQPFELAHLMMAIETAFPQLSMGMFSGYSERELDCMAVRAHVKARLDFAILGRYNRQAPACDPLVTSTNQKLWIPEGGRYTAADCAEPLSVEVLIDETGLTQITGFPILGGLSA